MRLAKQSATCACQDALDGGECRGGSLHCCAHTAQRTIRTLPPPSSNAYGSRFCSRALSEGLALQSVMVRLVLYTNDIALASLAAAWWGTRRGCRTVGGTEDSQESSGETCGPIKQTVRINQMSRGSVDPVRYNNRISGYDKKFWFIWVEFCVCVCHRSADGSPHVYVRVGGGGGRSYVGGVV